MAKVEIYDCEFGGKWKLNFDPTRYTTCANAAKAFHKAICKYARELGMNPDIEVALLNPEQSMRAGTGDNWRVIWECGPFEWAIFASEVICNMRHNSKDGRDHWYTEPYYSFDLCFTS